MRDEGDGSGIRETHETHETRETRERCVSSGVRKSC